MNKEQLLNEIEIICKDVFNKSDITITENTNSDDIEGWDSITNVFFIDSIEKKFDIKLSLMEIMNIDNVGDLIKILLERK